MLLRCLPDISRHACFALKGGTAINLFLQDLPRISVDIDLNYLPLKPRSEAFREIQDALISIKAEIERHIPGTWVQGKKTEDHVSKLFVSTKDSIVKIEPNLVFRGAVYKSQVLDLSSAAQNHFQEFASIQIMSRGDLYGSKLCAALDRQHPRDLFDIKLLMEGIGITTKIRRAFVVYLAGSSRPMSELLSPRILNIEKVFEKHFMGMVRDEVSIADLLEIQRVLPGYLVNELDNDEKEFLVSVKRGEPEWGRLGIEYLDQFPALKWKIINIRKMDPGKHKKALERLIQILQ